MKKYDLFIVGAGAAGITAGIYAARYRLNSIIVGTSLGGMTGWAHRICNFPSHEDISGMELMKKMMAQVKKLGVNILPGTIKEIKKVKGGFEIDKGAEKCFSKTILIATGSERKKLGLKNEMELIGKGISYCATCDAGFYKNKVVGVVGGSDAAVTAALLLSKFAKKVYIIYRGEKFSKAEPAWVEELEKDKKIEPLFNSEISEIIGKESLELIKLNDRNKLKLDGLFIEIGSEPNLELAKSLNLELEGKFISVDKNQKTNVPGIYAAGDITNNSLKQTITACGQGATAAYTAYIEITKTKCF